LIARLALLTARTNNRAEDSAVNANGASGDLEKASRMASTVRRLATSPAAAPPMPSATANTPHSGRIKAASSLFSRRQPMSLSTAAVKYGNASLTFYDTSLANCRARGKEEEVASMLSASDRAKSRF